MSMKAGRRSYGQSTGEGCRGCTVGVGLLPLCRSCTPMVQLLHPSPVICLTSQAAKQPH